MIPLLLSVTAIMAYFLGGLRLPEVCCRRFYERPLRSLGKGQQVYNGVYREYKIKGLVLVFLPELVKIVLVILVGGWLLGIKEQADAGRLFAFFCLVLGTLFPIMDGFSGRRALPELLVGSFVVNPTVGFIVAIIFAAVLYFTKYLSLATVVAALIFILGVFVFVGNGIYVELALFAAVLITVRHLGNLIRIIKHTEPKFTTRRDLSYKFEENF